MGKRKKGEEEVHRVGSAVDGTWDIVGQTRLRVGGHVVAHMLFAAARQPARVVGGNAIVVANHSGAATALNVAFFLGTTIKGAAHRVWLAMIAVDRIGAEMLIA